MSPYTEAPLPKSVIWLVVLDGKTSQTYHYCLAERIIPLGGMGKHAFHKQTMMWELHPLPDMALTAESLDTYKSGHDQMGSVSGSGSSVRSPVEHIDLRKELKARFAQTVAASIQQACREKRFDQLVLAAPPRMLSELRALLPPEVTDRIEAEIQKELTHCTPEELLVHIKAAFSAPHLHAV